MAINKVAVIGAGVMGSGIAAHVANAGHDVVLLDIVPDGAKKRSELALGAVERMLKTEPAAFMEKRTAKRVTCGNTEDDLKLLADADWIIEAVAQLVRTGTFFIPASIGAQEGAFLLVCGAITGSPTLGVSVSVVRRLREVIWIVWGFTLGSILSMKPGLVPEGDGDGG